MYVDFIQIIRNTTVNTSWLDDTVYFKAWRVGISSVLQYKIHILLYNDVVDLYDCITNLNVFFHYIDGLLIAKCGK